MKFTPIALLISLCLLFWGCKKENEKPLSLPVLVTSAAISITKTEAVSGGNVTSAGNLEILERGVCFSDTTAAPTLLNWLTTDGAGSGTFTSALNGLSPNTTYYVRAYARNLKGISFGNTVTFETLPTGPIPTLSTLEITQTGAYSTISGGSVSADGGSAIVARGVCWAINKIPTIKDFRTIKSGGIGDYLDTLRNLNSATSYFVRAYATNANGTAYGDLKAVTTTSGQAILSTSDTSSHTRKGIVTINGAITFNGNGPVVERGFVIGTFPFPDFTTGTKVVIPGTDNTPYKWTFTNLESYTTYYVRSYALNSFGTAYGNSISFRIEDMIILTYGKDSSRIRPTYLTVKGRILRSVGIQERGFVYSRTVNPTISDSRIFESPTDTGRYSFKISNLVPNTEYHVRAYAKHNLGIGYGPDQLIKTAAAYSIGQTLEGGKVFFINSDSSSGLIVGVADLPAGGAGISWGCQGVNISTDDALGSGRQNTLNIVGGCSTTGIAAHACSTYVSNSLKDWFLPSKLELQALVEKKTAVGLNSKFLWSSSQTNPDSAWVYAVDSARFVNVAKDTTKYFNRVIKVRPIRSFN